MTVNGSLSPEVSRYLATVSGTFSETSGVFLMSETDEGQGSSSPGRLTHCQPRTEEEEGFLTFPRTGASGMTNAVNTE